MIGKYRVNEIVKFSYSDIGEYIDENHTDKPLMNNEVVELLNELHEENQQLQSRINDYDVALKTLQDLTERKLKENEQLKQQNKGIQDKVWKLLELLEKEKGIDKRKIIDWWNGDAE